MKGDPKIIEHLNGLLRQELTAINQYFLHSRLLNDWGFERLGKIEHDESIDEMKHADELIERIIFLEGLPNLQDLDRLMIGETVKEVLDCDLKLEQRARPLYVEAIAYAEQVRDFVTRDLLQDILNSEEAHIDWLETQLNRIEIIGEERYQQSMLNPEHAP
ncbi:MAG: bacterioferritin [Parvularculaceae bacterium]